MIVECIDGDDITVCGGEIIEDDHNVIKGQLYEVIDVKDFEISRLDKWITFYKLREMPDDCWYERKLFRELDINISDIENIEELELKII